MSDQTSVLSGLTPEVENWPEGALFYSPIGLYGFQADGVARAYWQFVDSEHPALDVLYDTGVGKTIHTIAMAALLVEDNEIDQIIVVAEANKTTDWVRDFEKFSRVEVGAYAGTPTKRAKILSDPPKCMVMTYETGRNDICEFKGKKSKAVVANKMLTEALIGKRVLIVFDEFTKLRSRGNYLYTAWDYLINRVLRRTKQKTMVMGLTGTKLEKSPEDHFNANRLLAPWLSPSVKQFEKDHHGALDYWGNVTEYVNLTPETTRPGVIPLSERYAPITIRKRKTDPDVIGLFPARVENPPRYIDLAPAHREMYDAVKAMMVEDETSEGAAYTILRQIAADPASIIGSRSTLSQTIVDLVGPDALRSMASAKRTEMLRWVEEGGGCQQVIFTFFGQSVLPLLAEELRKQKYPISVNHGQMDARERQRSQDAFKAGDTQIFLSSDAGARGLNLGVGEMLLHYELPLLYSTFVQRSDRIHRIGGANLHPSVTIDSMVSKGTIEEGISELLLKRNAWSDAILNPDGFTEDEDPGMEILTAEAREYLWKTASLSSYTPSSRVS